MPRYSELEALAKREKIHRFWWNNVGAEGHISLPMLTKGISDEFGCKDNRSILTQVKVMQAELRIHIDMKFRVWIKEPLP
jgi:hypothetical protein